jgi:hypothetical protein
VIVAALLGEQISATAKEVASELRLVYELNA